METKVTRGWVDVNTSEPFSYPTIAMIFRLFVLLSSKCGRRLAPEVCTFLRQKEQLGWFGLHIRQYSFSYRMVTGKTPNKKSFNTR